MLNDFASERGRGKPARPGVPMIRPIALAAGLALLLGFGPHQPRPWAALRLPLAGEARSVALIVSDRGGWTPALDALADRLATLHTLAIGVDLAVLRARLAAAGCGSAAEVLQSVVADAVAMAGLGGGVPPTLIGLGQGAGFGHAALSGAGPVAFKGLVSLGWDAALPVDPALCTRAPPGPVPAPWTDVVTGDPGDRATRFPGLRVLRAGPDAGAVLGAYLAIAGTDAALHLAGTVPAALADLPLTLHGDPARGAGAWAVFLSGDGGWAPFDQAVADRLAARGVPVVGISALRYLWQERRPERIAADIARIADGFGPEAAGRPLMLVGFSLGASVTPFYAPLLPRTVAARVAAVILLAPEARTAFHLRIAGWLGRTGGEADVGAAIAGIAHLPVLCAHGMQEDASPCPRLAPTPGLTVAAFEGGHHLTEDMDALVDRIVAVAGGPAARGSGVMRGRAPASRNPRRWSGSGRRPRSDTRRSRRPG